MARFVSRLAALVLFASCIITLIPAPLKAQNPTGTISGRVTDSGGLPTPGVTVTAESPSLQGVRTTVTSQNGDYIFRLLPPGKYVITFQLTGFAVAKDSRSVGAAEPVVLDITLWPATVSENITVRADTGIFANTSEAATNIRQELTTALPTTRTLLAAVNLAPSVHATGPSNAVSIGGGMSFENVFMLNGVQIQDNIRNTPLNLFIEDAIQETTVATSGVSAEYGRFTGGMVNAITKSGGNDFSGSFRTTITNDEWRTISPQGEPKTDRVVPTYEFTVGGPIKRNRTWFFGAGRWFDSTTAEETGLSGVDYELSVVEKRFEAKLTQALGSGHRLQGSYTDIRRQERNVAWPSAGEVLDLRSLTTRELPQNLLSIHYSGVYGTKFFVEGQFSARNLTFVHSGGTNKDLIQGTPLRDQQTGFWWWAPNFCGVCTDEQRDNTEFVVKGSYFLSTNRGGSHNLVFGYDGFNDRLNDNNNQSATDYHVWTTDIILRDSTVYPVSAPDGSTFIIYWPVQESSKGTNFRTHSLFVNDTWRYNSHVSFNLGLRYDKNHGRDGSENLVAKDSTTSPRLGVVWDPTGSGRTTINASVGRYVASLANAVAGSTAPAGTPAIIAWFYLGQPINMTPGAPLVSSEAALQTIFSWFNANGGTSRRPFFTNIPGVQTQIRGSLDSPHADEFTVGFNRQFGANGAVRVDVVSREFGGFYADRIDQTTGIVSDADGNEYDLDLIENTDVLERRYAALTGQATYRFGTKLMVGGNYTLSRLWGNVNGENVGTGPLTSQVLAYPEFYDSSWSSPEGDLAADQRHRARIWTTIDLMSGLSLGLLQQVQSGTPYGAVGNIRTAAYVHDPGYVTPPDTVTYYFKPRDAFHTETMLRTDVSVNYRRRVSNRNPAELFVQGQFLNIFNQFQAFNIRGNEINSTVVTAVDDPARFRTFNPFTETPVQGQHWDYGSKFGKPTDAGAYTLPFSFQFSVGVRF